MSHATVALTPATSALMSSIGTAAAASAGGLLLAAGAIAAAKRLRCEYESAKIEFDERCKQDEIAFQQ